MATVTPAIQSWSPSQGKTVLWEACATGDTIEAYNPVGKEAAFATVQAFGTWGGATLVLQGSNDGGTTWAAIDDMNGTAVSFTANGYAGIRTAFNALRVAMSGGTGDDVDVWLSLRGDHSA